MDSTDGKGDQPIVTSHDLLIQLMPLRGGSNPHPQSPNLSYIGQHQHSEQLQKRIQIAAEKEGK
jgi:hypothetical protein